MKTRLFLRRHFTLVLALVSAAAFLLRLWVSFQLRDGYPPVAEPGPMTDMNTYLSLAKQVLDGSYDYSKGYFFQPFYYTVFLPILGLLIGPGAGPIIVAHSLLGGGTVFLTGLVAARLFGRPAGLVAAVWLALDRIHVFYTPFALNETLLTFCFCAFICTALRALSLNRLSTWICAAGILGVADTIRGSMAFVFPALAFAFIWANRGRRSRLPHVLTLWAVFMVPHLPYSLVNLKAHGRWVGTASLAKYPIAVGNNPEAPPGGREPLWGAGAMSFSPTAMHWAQLQEAPPPRSASVERQVLRWVVGHPLAFLELKWRAFLLFWNRVEIPNNVGFLDWNPRTGRLETPPSAVLCSPLLLDFLPLGTMGLVGVLIVLPRFFSRPKWGVAALFVVAFCLSVTAFYVLARYRLPVRPLLCAFAAFATLRLLLSLKRLFGRKPSDPPGAVRRQCLALLVPTALAAVFVGCGFDLYRAYAEAEVVRLALPDGVHLELADRRVVRDSGPQAFGGWTPVIVPPSPASVTIRKTWAVDPETERLDRPRLVFPTVSNGGATLYIAHKNGARTTARTPPGLHSVEVPLSAPLDVSPDGRRATVEIAISASGENTASLYFDVQRRYGRTRVTGAADPGGEWVVDLVLPSTAVKP